MSNLLKSKLFIGVMVVAVLVAGGLSFASQASAQQANVSASDIQYAATVKQGSSGQAVLIWQKFLNDYSSANLVADGAFGPLSSAAARTWQAARGLVADGVMGPMSRAAAMAQIGAGPMTGAYPAGCTSWSGFSTSTGLACTAPAPSGLPAGCSSTAGFSPTTGVRCDSGSSLPAGCTSTSGFSPTTGASCSGGSTPSTGGLSGGAGNIEDADWVSGLTGEEVGEGADDVQVAGLDIDADDGSDLRLTAVRLDFTFGTADQDFEDYASEVSLWFDGEEVARVDGDVFTDDNNYDKTLTLDGDAVIKAGDTGRLVVAISGVSNLDTNDVGDTWTVEFESVRYEDASGAILTDTATGDINGVTRTFSFESFATSTDTEFKIALKTGAAADAINDAHVIDVHATEGTDNVRLLAFTLEAEGDSDLEIREFLVDLVVTNAAHVDDMVQGGTSPAVRLIIDGEEYGTATYVLGTAEVGTDEEVFFDDVNYTLAAGDTVDAYIEVDLNDTTGTTISDDMDVGDTILAQITAAQHAALTDIDVRDETGTQLALADIIGTAVGGANTVLDEGIMVEFVSSTATKSYAGDVNNTLDHDKGTFTITFDVTAFDADMYIDGTKPTEGAAATTIHRVAVSNTDTYVDSNIRSSTGATLSGTLDGDGEYLVEEGTTERFTITYVTEAGADGLFQVSLNGISYTDAAETGDTLYSFNLSEFTTPSVDLNADL